MTTPRTIPLAACRAGDLKAGDTARVVGVGRKAHTILTIKQVIPTHDGAQVILRGIASRKGTNGVHVSRTLPVDDLVTVFA